MNFVITIMFTTRILYNKLFNCGRHIYGNCMVLGVQLFPDLTVMF